MAKFTLMNIILGYANYCFFFSFHNGNRIWDLMIKLLKNRLPCLQGKSRKMIATI